MRLHGSCDLIPAEATKSNMLERSKSFGIGYRDEIDNGLSHYLWCSARDNSENGPYDVALMVFQSREQFGELMAVIRGWGDQIRLVQMREPGPIHLQDFLDRPFSRYQATKDGKFENTNRAFAYWQVRICDLKQCLARTHLPGQSLRFNLRLLDPIRQHLPKTARWQGIEGEYIVQIGEESTATEGTAPDILTMEATVGGFTRMWIGALTARGVAFTGEISAPPELIENLDRVFCLPTPHLDWDF